MVIGKGERPGLWGWLRSDEWNYFVLPDVLFAFLLFAYLLAR